MDLSYQAHIETATTLLEEVSEGLETLVVITGNSAWNPEAIERAKEVLALQGYDISHLSRQQIKGHVEYFRDRIKLFERLRDNPDDVYEKFPDRARLLNMCEDFRKFYADNHQVLGCVENQFSEDETAD